METKLAKIRKFVQSNDKIRQKVELIFGNLSNIIRPNSNVTYSVALSSKDEQMKGLRVINTAMLSNPEIKDAPK